MEKNLTINLSLIVLFCSVFSFFTFAHAEVDSETKNTRNPSAIEHIIMPIVKIPNFFRLNAKLIRIFAYSNNKLDLIPYQIDQKNQKGLILLDHDLRELRKNDEILWMASDMGEKAPINALLNHNPRGEWFEIEVTKEGKQPLWVYLLHTNEPLAPSLKDYVSYDKEKDLIQTPYYFLSYRDIIVADRFGWVINKNDTGPNLLTRVAVRLRARALFGLIPIEISEKNLRSKIIGLKDGAIRVIKRIHTVPQLPLGISGPSNQTDVFYYRNSFENEVKIHFPPGAKLLLNRASFQIFVDVAQQEYNVNLVMPNNKSFDLKKDLEQKTYTVSDKTPAWIHFGSKEVSHHFAVCIWLPPESSEVLTPEELMYEHYGENHSNPETMGTLSFKVKLKSKMGDHFFRLYLFAPLPSQENTADNFAINEINEIQNTFLHYEISSNEVVFPNFKTY